MSIILFEGWEQYSNFENVKSFLSYENNSTISIISATDANSVTPRNSGACLKFSNVENDPVYPKVLLNDPAGANHTSGVFGFAWHSYLPAGGSVSRFTPLAGVIDPSGIAHFYVGINSSGNIEARRWTGSAAWNASEQGGVYPLFNASQYALLGTTSGNTILANDWNYIEVKYALATSGVGSIQIRLNNSKFGSNILNLTNVQTTQRANVNARSLVIGRHFGNDAGSDGSLGTHNLIYTSYIDDVYWCNSSGTTYNDFLGRVSCQKTTFDTVVDYSFDSPVDSGAALSNISDLLSNTSISSNITAQFGGRSIGLRTSGVQNIGLQPVLVRQTAFGYRTDTSADLFLGIQGGDTVASITTNASGSLAYRDYDAPLSQPEWNSDTIGGTVFYYKVFRS